MKTIKDRYADILKRGYMIRDELQKFCKDAWGIQQEAGQIMSTYIGRYFKVREPYHYNEKLGNLEYFVILDLPKTMEYGSPNHLMYDYSRTPAYGIFSKALPVRCLISLSVFNPLSDKKFDELYEEIPEDEFINAIQGAVHNYTKSNFGGSSNENV